MRFRYSRWDGTQDPFGPDVDTSEVLEELSDEIFMGGSPDGALQRLLRRGMRGRFSGMDALRNRLQQRREQEQDMLNLAGPAGGRPRTAGGDRRARAHRAELPRR